MTTSKFLQGTKTYIAEAAVYLDKRGLSIQELPIVPYKSVDLGFYVKDGQGFIPLPLEGWAFQVRRPDGEYYDDRWLLRVCNWPERDLFSKKGGKITQVAGVPPKFLQISTKGADCTNFVSTVSEMCHAKTVMFHEKYTSAALTKKLLGIPSIALSGCHNWSTDGKLKESIADMIRLMEPSTKIVVCFDGDIVENPNVMHAASQLKGWIATIREDITVVFPMVPPLPEEMNGWDDFTVFQGENAQSAWLEMLAADGVDVSSALPIQHLITKYQVKVKVLRDKLVLEHSPENYRRLLAHPMWTKYAMDFSGVCYDISSVPVEPMSFDELAWKYEAWLADVPYVGDGANVSSGKVKGALREEMRRRTISVAHHLLAQRPVVTDEEAKQAALDLITKGIKVKGPMTEEQTVETFLRISYDMVALWSTDRDVDVHWVLALVGPSGCGKSNFPISFTKCMERWGVRSVSTSLPKDGPKAAIEELYRSVRGCLIAGFDEYNPAETMARQVEQNIYTLSTTRMFSQRKLYETDLSEEMRRAALFLTTVDKNQAYMRAGKGAGGERRFITMEVMGVMDYYGILASNRAVIDQCGETLLVWAYQQYAAGNERGTATEFSQPLAGQFVTQAPIVGRIANIWAKVDIQKVLDNFGEQQFRKGTGDWRFSLAQIQTMLLQEEKLGRMDISDLKELIVELGAEHKGQGRVNTPSGERMKDSIYAVKDWDAWCLALHAKL
jgi:hypothetical protein